MATNNSKPPDAGAPEIEVTPQMIAAGERQLFELLEVRESAYVVREVFLAMLALSSFRRPR